MNHTQVKLALRYYVHGEGAQPDYATLQALIAKGLLTTAGEPTNLGRDAAGDK